MTSEEAGSDLQITVEEKRVQLCLKSRFPGILPPGLWWPMRLLTLGYPVPPAEATRGQVAG